MKLTRDHVWERAVLATMDLPDWVEPPRAFTGGGFGALIQREHCGGRPEDPLRWHISVSGPGRVPTWQEMVEVVHDLRPGVPFVMGIPPRSQWTNVHEHVLHAWECGDEALLEEWRVNALGQEPT